MDYPITRKRFESMPFREDLEQSEYVPLVYYRTKHQSNAVLQYTGELYGKPLWELWIVCFID